MLIVRNNNREELVLESNYEKYEEQNGLALQISFDSYYFEKNLGHQLIDYNVIIQDEDNHEYVVKQLEINKDTKRVLANHIYFELIGHRKYTDFSGTRNFNQFANWLFEGTGWTFQNVDVFDTLNFNSFGNDNFLQLIQRLITKFNCEMQILPSKVITFRKIIGRDNDLQYRYRNNIKEISQTIDTTNVRTRITAYGAEGLSVNYTSNLASNPLFGILDAEPVTDESITNTSDLIEFAKSNLNDVPETNIVVSVLDLNGNVGDYVWIIHELMGLEYQARILSKRTRRRYEESEVEIGNSRKRTIEDVLISQKEEVKQNKEESEQAISELEEKTEQDLAIITDGLTELRFEVTNVENTLRSEIIQTADSIRLQVQEVDNSVASLEIRADQIQSNVTNLQNSTSSSITQLSNEISLKIDKGGAITDINLTPGTATINADKINLNGAVFINGSITGSTDITVNTNATIGNALYFGGYSGSIDFIDISGSGMTLSSTNVNIDVSGSLYLNGRRVLTEDDL